MDACEPLGVILFWDEYDVHLWLSRLGLPQYEEQIRGMPHNPLTDNRD